MVNVTNLTNPRVTTLLPGAHFEYTQGHDESGAPAVLPANYAGFEAKKRKALTGCEGGRRGGRRPVVLAFFIGGVTFAEISCLRFLSEKMNVEVDFIVGTTKIVSASSLIDTLIDTKDNFAPADTDEVQWRGEGGGGAKGGGGGGASGS